MRGLWHSLVFHFYLLTLWVRSVLRLEQPSQPVAPSTDSSGSPDIGDDTGSLETSMNETEVKFVLDDYEVLMKRLALCKAVPTEPESYYSAHYFDNANGDLEKAGVQLRFREEGDKKFVCYKGPTTSTTLMVREELEQELQSWTQLAAIFSRLGYSPKRQLQKLREKYRLPGVEVCVDQVWFGTFVELEGDSGAIRHWAMALGFDWDSRITKSYLELESDQEAEETD